MENQIRKELSELCQSILDNTDNETLSEHLTKSQMLYEKLLILNYLEQSKEEKAPKAKMAESLTIESIAPKPIEEPIAEKKTTLEVVEETQSPESGIDPVKSEEVEENEEKKGLSINESLAGKTLQFGLNDRIAFVKHLFMGEQEDFNRVVSQLNTFANYEEAELFLEQMIKPDYSWNDKEEYAERFIHLVKLRFGIES